MSAEVFWWSGTFIALGGGAVADWALFIRGQPKGRLRCPRCWYDMAGAMADDGGAHTCPECGRRIVKARQLRQTRRFWRLAVFGLSLAIAGAGTWATPMLRAEKWQRHAPSTLLVMLADTDSFYPTGETWRELRDRARYGQLSVRHRTVLSERLAKGVSADELLEGWPVLDLIYELRPGRSQALAELMSMFIPAWEKRNPGNESRGLFWLRQERSLDDDEPLLDRPRLAATRRFLLNLYPGRSGNQPSSDSNHKYAIEILGRVGSEEAVETLSASLRTRGNPNRELAAIALGRIGGDAAIDALTEMVADRSGRGVLAAAVALAMIGEPARDQAEPEIDVWFTITYGAEERAVLAACLRVLRGKEAHVSIPLMRLFLADRIGKEYVSMLREDAMPSLPLIMSYLDDEGDRALVWRALDAIDTFVAADALPVLDEMATKLGEDPMVQFLISQLRRPD